MANGINIFKASTPVIAPAKNKFNLSHEKKLSLLPGHLVPIANIDVVPGDRFRMSYESILRFAPMLAPIFHMIDIYTHSFFVPYRIIWPSWEKFLAGSAGAPTTVPHIKWPIAGSVYKDKMQQGFLADYMGVPPLVTPTVVGQEFSLNQLPFRAYQEIYNEWYRDQTLSPKIEYDKSDNDLVMVAVDPIKDAFCDALMDIRNRAWEKDYFTTAQPFPQFGSTGAGVPVQTTQHRYRSSDALVPGSVAIGSASGEIKEMTAAVATYLEGSALINDLRKANSLQKFLEAMARSGQRYIEVLKNLWGVETSDYRLQRPQYLGGGKQNILISEVLSTYDNSTADLPQGLMTGQGNSSGKTESWEHTFEEHGQIITILSVLPRAGYGQGRPRQFSRRERFDYYWPQFANLGEQEILNEEVYQDSSDNTQKETWGYQSRYAEYKFLPSTVHGDFRTTMTYWHVNKIFTDVPPLNEDFVLVPVNVMDRIFANTTKWDHKIWAQIWIDCDALRPMPVHSIPTL